MIREVYLHGIKKVAKKETEGAREFSPEHSNHDPTATRACEQEFMEKRDPESGSLMPQDHELRQCRLDTFLATAFDWLAETLRE